MPDFTIKDSGARTQFAGGGVRDTEDGKLDYTLVTDGPMFERWAAHLTKGAKKYEARNWMKFQDDVAHDRAVRSAFRHFVQWLRGERDEDHAAGVFFNINVAEYIDSLPTLCMKSLVKPDVEALTTEVCRNSGARLGAEISVGVHKRPLRIYVAGPFSAPTEHGRNCNRDHAIQIWRALMVKGHLAHCPHQATDPGHGIVPYEQFMDLDFSLIREWANALFFMGSSPGADRELALAKSLGLAIYYNLSDVPNLKVSNETATGSLAVGPGPTSNGLSVPSDKPKSAHQYELGGGGLYEPVGR